MCKTIKLIAVTEHNFSGAWAVDKDEELCAVNFISSRYEVVKNKTLQFSRRTKIEWIMMDMLMDSSKHMGVIMYDVMFSKVEKGEGFMRRFESVKFHD